MQLNLVILLIVSVIGLLDTGYLFYQKTVHKNPVACPLKGKCEIVLESKWSKMFGVKTELLGLLFYLVVFFSGLALMTYPAIFMKYINLLFIFILSGFVFASYLFYIQVKVIKHYCFYCIFSDVLILILLINVSTLIR